MLALLAALTLPAHSADFASHSVVLLRKGPAWTQTESPETAALMKGHLAHFTALKEKGSLLFCGPLAEQKDESLRGMCIYNTDLKATQALAEADPRVKAGHLTVEVMTLWHEADALK